MQVLTDAIIWILITAAGVFLGLEAHSNKEKIVAWASKKAQEAEKKAKQAPKEEGCCGGQSCEGGSVH